MEQAGFTIVELMIATVIFAGVLVIIVFAYFFVCNDYLKGSVESQTQSTARAIIEQVSEDIQLNNFGVSQPVTSGGINMICIGNHRYTYQYNTELVSGSPGTDETNHDFVVDSVSGCTSSSTIQPLNSSNANITGAELLADNMRLGNFSVTPNPAVSGQYTISVTIAYGSDTSQGGPLVVQGTGAPYSYSCPDLNLGGKFCATATLSTVVQQRVTGG